MWPIPVVGPIPEDPAEGMFMGGLVGAAMTEPGQAIVGAGWRALKTGAAEGWERVGMRYAAGAAQASGWSAIARGLGGVMSDVPAVGKMGWHVVAGDVQAAWAAQRSALAKTGASLGGVLGGGAALGAGIGLVAGLGFSALRSNRPYR